MFWLRRRSQREGRQWLAAFLARAPNVDDETSMNLRASALEGAAWLAEDGQDFAQAAALFAQGGALRLALGQDERTTGLLINAAMEARAGGDYARATILLEESLARHRAQGNREGILVGGLGLSLSRLALVLAEQGEYARATALHEECLALVRGLGDREGVGITLLGLGDIARDQGVAARTRTYCEECLALFRDLGYQWAIGFSLNNLALAANLDGNLALAAQQAEESVAIFRGLQAGPSLAEVLVTLGRVRDAQGEGAAAHAHLTEALTLASAQGPRVVVAAALDALGVQEVRLGRAQQGVHLLAAAARLRQAMGTPVRPADRPNIEAALAAARGVLDDAAFAEAWATGQALPVARIVAHGVTVREDALWAPE
jgi:tetratricopeptide (TPR) repeat protein